MFVLCKACNTDVEPGIDRDTVVKKQATKDTKAICPKCKEAIPLSIYMVKTLVRAGKFYTKPKSEKAFSFECDGCAQVGPAQLSKDRKSASCGDCGIDLQISNYMIRAMALAAGGGEV